MGLEALASEEEEIQQAERERAAESEDDIADTPLCDYCWGWRGFLQHMDTVAEDTAQVQKVSAPRTTRRTGSMER